MPNSNVCATTSHWGVSDANKHNLTPARPETEFERYMRHFMMFGPNCNTYECYRQHGFVTYSPKL